MDKREAEFAAKLLETFRVEAEEHFQAISNGLLSLETANLSLDDRLETLSTIYREAHNLKGAARAVNLTAIQDVCQSIESVFSKWKEQKEDFHPQFESLYQAVDWMKAMAAGAEKETAKFSVDELIDKIKKLLEAPLEAIVPTSQPTEKTSPYSLTKHPKPVKTETSKPKTIRFSSEKLDRILNLAEELLVVKIHFNRTNKHIREFEHSFVKWMRQEKSLGNALGQLKHLKESEVFRENFPKESAQLSQLMDFLSWQHGFFRTFSEQWDKYSKLSKHDMRFIVSMIDTLIDETKKALMQPLSSLLESFPRMVRDIAHATEKEVQFETSGSEIEIDRRILEEMKDPLIHLIRNAIDHGIENPADRQSANKPAAGKIHISAEQKSNHVEIIVSDDGGGINVNRVKEAAKKQGFSQIKNIDALDEKDAMRLIFQQGISTSPLITDLSGRGLGMGIVAEKVEKLGGKIDIQSTLTQGTTFHITLPITLATFRGIHISVAGQEFILPTNHIKKVLRLSIQDIKTVENCEILSEAGSNLSYIYLGNLLNLEKQNRNPGNYLYILIISAVDVSIAVGVDEILTEQEVFMKSLGKQLAQIKNISGATILEAGKVIPILNPFDLIKSVITQTPVQSTETDVQEAHTSGKKIVLVVDDSATARILLQNIMETAGYIVKTAINGSEAFNILLTDRIDILLSDVEMPGLNGFELTKKIRETERVQTLPIVLVTTRGSKEDREKGIESGANAYINKGSFEQSHLLDIVQKLL